MRCANENNAVVRYGLPEHNCTILASKYEMVLSSEKVLLK